MNQKKQPKMETWILYALISMVFAGITSILAKYGLQNINSDLGLGIRTTTIFFLIVVFILTTDKLKDLPLITNKQYLLLILSGVVPSGLKSITADLSNPLITFLVLWFSMIISYCKLMRMF